MASEELKMIIDMLRGNSMLEGTNFAEMRATRARRSARLTETGKALWSWYLGSPQLATPIIQGDLVFSSYPNRGINADAPFVIAAFDLKTGAPKWRRWIDADSSPRGRSSAHR